MIEKKHIETLALVLLIDVERARDELQRDPANTEKYMQSLALFTQAELLICILSGQPPAVLGGVGCASPLDKTLDAIGIPYSMEKNEVIVDPQWMIDHGFVRTEKGGWALDTTEDGFPEFLKFFVL